MRRSRLFLPLFLLAVAAIAGLYTAYWFVAAGRIRAAVMDWAEARRVAGYTVGWDRVGVAGFPFAFRVNIEAPVLGDNHAQPGWEARGAQLVGEAKPWAPQVWRLDKSLAGSGALGDLGAHIIDLARHLVGEPKSVMAMTKTFIPERPTPDGKSKVKVDVDDAFISLVEMDPRHVPAWMVVIIIGREFAVSGLRSIAAQQGVTIAASGLGKVKTIAQVIAISPPNDVLAEDIGAHLILDTITLHEPEQNNGIAVSRRYLTEHRDAVLGKRIR